MSDIFHLVYISEAVEDISYTDIRDILEVSRIRNVKSQLTGLLLFREGLFLQLLEGEELQVRQTMSKIAQDDRHHHIKNVFEGTSPDRVFLDWSMAYLDGDISAGSSNEVEKLFTSLQKQGAAGNVLPALRQFRASIPEFKQNYQ